MRNALKTAPFAVIATAALALGACTSETEADTEIAPEETDTVGIEAPGLRTVPGDNGPKSAGTDQPTLGADSVSGDLGSPVAEPGMDIEGSETVRGNQGAANE